LFSERFRLWQHGGVLSGKPDGLSQRRTHPVSVDAVNVAAATRDMTGDRGSEQRPSQVWSVLDPVVIGLLAAAVSLAGAARPSFWYDEAATISAAYSRSLGQLWQMVGEVDAVHGLYYLLMHGWFQLFAPTEFWSRAPSGLAVGAAAAGLVVLGKQLCSRGVGVTSGAVCAILPRATWAGIEARPYAMSMMAAVWLTVLLVYAARRDTAWVWVTYGAVLAVSIVLDVYLALLSAVHLGFVLVAPYGRTVVLRVLLTALVVLGATAPLVFVAMGQVHQIAWITPIGSRTLEDVAVQQYFDRSPPFAIVSALVVAVAIVVWLFTSRRMDVGQRTSVVLASAWLAIPTGIIVIWSVLATRSTHRGTCASPRPRWPCCWASASCRSSGHPGWPLLS